MEVLKGLLDLSSNKTISLKRYLLYTREKRVALRVLPSEKFPVRVSFHTFRGDGFVALQNTSYLVCQGRIQAAFSIKRVRRTTSPLIRREKGRNSVI